MRRMLTLTIASLFAGMALAGCTGGNDGGSGGGGGGGGGGAAPQAIASASATSVQVGESITFSAQQAGDNNVTWRFGDGANGTGASATHTYTVPGDYIVHLNVTNARGQTATNEASLIYIRVAAVRDLANATGSLDPSAEFTIDRQVIQIGGNVTVNASRSSAWVENPDYDPETGVTPDNLPFLRDCRGAACAWNASGPANLTLSWDWGDGETGTGQEATHTYATAGVYTVTLTATDAAGNEGKRAATVLVLGQAPAVGGFKNKDLFVTATISGPQSFDPGFDYETAGGHIISQVYETLFSTERGNADRIVPELAAEVPTRDNGGIDENGTRYVIKLRQNVKFHDGTTLNASAVKFSLDRAILLNDPSSGAAVLAPALKGARDYRLNSNNTAEERQAWLALNAVEVVDEYTVAINLDASNAAFFQRLAFYGTSIVSPTAFKACHQERVPLWGVCQTADGLPPPASGSRAAATRDPWADTHAVGTGPFVLRTWIPADRVILDRFDGYWGAKPQLKTVIVQYVDDLNTRILMLRSGDADEIYVSGADVKRVRPGLEGVARFTETDTLIVDAAFWAFDVKDPAACPKRADGSAACQMFQDAKVREAFAHAFDYNTFINDVWQGLARQLPGVIPRGMPGFDESLQAPSYDVERARTAIQASNYSGGFTVDVYYNTGNTVRQGGAELLKRNIEALGPNFRVNVVPVPFNVLLDKSQKSELPLFFLGWSPDYIATDDYIEPFLHSQGTYGVSTSMAAAPFSAELDAMIEEALHETDPATQAEMYTEINRYAVENNVFLFLDQRTQTHVERTYVQGYYYDPLHSGQPNIGDYAAISKA